MFLWAPSPGWSSPDLPCARAAPALFHQHSPGYIRCCYQEDLRHHHWGKWQWSMMMYKLVVLVPTISLTFSLPTTRISSGFTCYIKCIYIWTWVLIHFKAFYSQSSGRNAGEPLVQTSLSPELLVQFEELCHAMNEEYTTRFSTLLKRLDLTITSFKWSKQAKVKMG